MAFTRSDVLATAERSPAAAGARDKNAWVGLFTADGRVEDPVGSQPHQGLGAIGAFFDTFIGPRHITYRPDADIVTGSTVLRDGELDIAMGPVQLHVPVYIRYDVREGGDGLKIAALSAFWELPAMVGQFMRAGFGGLPAGLVTGEGTAREPGRRRSPRLPGGLRGPVRRASGGYRSSSTTHVRATRSRCAVGSARSKRDERRRPPVDDRGTAVAHCSRAPRKMIASGYSVVVGLDRDGRRDVLIVEVTAKPFAIRRIRYFTEDPVDG